MTQTKYDCGWNPPSVKPNESSYVWIVLNGIATRNVVLGKYSSGCFLDNCGDRFHPSFTVEQWKLVDVVSLPGKPKPIHPRGNISIESSQRDGYYIVVWRWCSTCNTKYFNPSSGNWEGRCFDDISVPFEQARAIVANIEFPPEAFIE